MKHTQEFQGTVESQTFDLVRKKRTTKSIIPLKRKQKWYVVMYVRPLRIVKHVPKLETKMLHTQIHNESRTVTIAKKMSNRSVTQRKSGGFCKKQCFRRKQGYGTTSTPRQVYISGICIQIYTNIYIYIYIYI